MPHLHPYFSSPTFTSTQCVPSPFLSLQVHLHFCPISITISLVPHSFLLNPHVSYLHPRPYRPILISTHPMFTISVSIRIAPPLLLPHPHVTFSIPILTAHCNFYTVPYFHPSPYRPIFICTPFQRAPIPCLSQQTYLNFDPIPMCPISIPISIAPPSLLPNPHVSHLHPCLYRPIFISFPSILCQF